jgi:hypothetical protein
MKKNKMFLTLALLIASFSFAIPKGPCDKKEVCCEEPAPGPFAFYYPKDMNLSCPKDFYVSGEFLLMQVKEEGLEYAITQNTITQEIEKKSNSFPLTGGDIQGYSEGHHNWDWTYGCRVAMGFYLNYDCLNAAATWTYIRINNDSGKNVSGGLLLPFWLPPNLQVGGGDELDNIASSARWTGNLNTLDLKLGKPYHISRYVIFNPYIGLRMAWIDQDYTSRNAGTFVSPVDQDENPEMNAKNDFWGVGPRVGIDTEWRFAGSWYFFGNVAASILYSHFDVSQELIFGEDTLYQLKHDFYTNSPNMEITFGLCWCHLFCKNKYMVSLKAAYEMHYWWEQNRLRRFFDKDIDTGGSEDISASSSNDEVARGDLTVNGFSFTIQFDF